MRRITLTVVITLAILVLLFSYRTSRHPSVTASTVAVGPAHVVSAGSTVAGSSAAGPDPISAAPKGRIAVSPPPASVPSSESGTPSAPATGRSVATPAPSAASRRRPPATTAPADTTKSSAATPTATRSPTTTVDGAVVSTQYGDVQVEVTISNARITDVQALQYPNQQPLDQQINADALPQLQAQVLSAQSANIAGVSGATYTTQGYIGSLQSALDAAKFK